MLVRRFQAADADEWDRFVEASVNGTMMHLRRFLAYHPADRFRDHSLMFLDSRGQIVAVLPAAEIVVNGHRQLRSHPGASYGGLVVASGIRFADCDSLVRSLVTSAREQQFDSVQLRLSEPIFHRSWCQELDAAFFRHGFAVQSRELSSAVRLDGLGEDDVLSKFDDRSTVHKATRDGCSVRLSNDFAGFWRILQSNLADRFGVAPTHTLDEMLRLCELLPGRIILIGAYFDGRLISGSVLFVMNDVAAHTMYMARDYRFQQHRSLNLVLCATLGECVRRGMRWLNFGISSIPGTQGREMNEGLHDFKRRCGGEGVLRETLLWSPGR